MYIPSRRRQRTVSVEVHQEKCKETVFSSHHFEFPRFHNLPQNIRKISVNIRTVNIQIYFFYFYRFRTVPYGYFTFFYFNFLAVPYFFLRRHVYVTPTRSCSLLRFEGVSCYLSTFIINTV
jgi:hypothetical protein